MRTSTEDRLALRDWLQAVEDDLIDAGKRHVFIHGSEGVLEWSMHGATDEPGENVALAQIDDLEDMLVGAGRRNLSVALESGSVRWALQP